MNIWWTLVPEITNRGFCLAVAMIMAPSLYGLYLECRHENCAAKVFSLVKASHVFGSLIGPLLGNLLKYMSFMTLYYSTAGIAVVPTMFLAFQVRYFQIKMQNFK